MKYYTLAGKRAADNYSNQEALGYYQRALELVGEGEEDAILMERAKVLLDTYQGNRAAGDYERLLERTRQRGDRKQELESMLGLASAYLVIAYDEPEYAPRSRDLCEQAYVLASDLDDREAKVRALITTNFFPSFWPEYWDQAAANAEEAMAISQEIGDEELITESMVLLFDKEPHAFGEGEWEELLRRVKARGDLRQLKELYFDLMWEHLYWGNFERCIECCGAGISLAERIGVPPVMYPTIKALALINLGRYDEAWESLQEEVADEEHPFGRAFMDFGTGVYFLELMVYERAAAIFDSVIEQARLLGRPWLRRLAQTRLFISLLRDGKLDKENLNKIIRDLESMGDVSSHVMAEAALWEGKLDEALRQAEKSCAEEEEGGWLLNYVRALELQLRILLKLERPGDVIPLADKGIRTAGEMGYGQMAWRIRAAKGQALAMLGDAGAAADEYQAAAGVIRELADNVSDPGLKQTFLSNALVAPVLNEGDRRKRKE